MALFVIGISVCLFTFRMHGCKSGGGFVPTTHYKLIDSQVRERGFMFMKSSICSNFSLSRRDVDFPRRDVNLTPLYHVATCIFTSRRQFVHPSVTSRRVFSRRTWICTSLCHVATSFSTSRRHFNMTLSRRDVASNVATWIKSTLYYVATLPPTSRCCLVKLSVTSRRDPARRDVTLF